MAVNDDLQTTPTEHSNALQLSAHDEDSQSNNNSTDISVQNGELQQAQALADLDYNDQHVLEDIARFNQLEPSIPWARVREIVKSCITLNVEQLKKKEAALFDKQSKPPWPLSEDDLRACIHQIWTLLDQFPENAPFTIQRLAELSLSPYPYYSNSLPAYLRAILRCVCVSSSVEEIPDSPPPPDTFSPTSSTKSLPPSPSFTSSSPLLTSTSTSILPANLPSAFHSDDEDDDDNDHDEHNTGSSSSSSISKTEVGKKKKKSRCTTLDGPYPLRRTRSETSADISSNVRRKISRQQQQHHQQPIFNNQQRSLTAPSSSSLYSSSSSSSRRHSSVLSLNPHTPQLTPTPFFFNRLRDASSHDDNIGNSTGSGGLIASTAAAAAPDDSMAIDVKDDSFNHTNPVESPEPIALPHDPADLQSQTISTHSLESDNSSNTPNTGSIFEGMFGSLKDRFIPESSSSS